MEIQLSTIQDRCPICGDSIQFIFRLGQHDRTWEIFECENCHVRFINPIPDNDELSDMYAKYYTDDTEQNRRLLDPKYGRLSFPRQWGIIKNIAHKKSGKILDYGCGGGHFLDRVSRKWDKYGIELSAEARKIANTKSIKTFSDLIEANFPEKYFDVITMFATIEHLPNPKEIVTQLTKLLKINGVFVLMTGDVSSTVAINQGNKWHLYAPPGHIFYFTAYSLNKFMLSMGYNKIKSIHTDGGETRVKFMPLNLILRVGIEIFERLPLFRSIPLFDCYYGYYRRTI